MMNIEIQWLGGPSLMLGCKDYKALVDPIEYTSGEELIFPGFSSTCTQSSHFPTGHEKSRIKALLQTHGHGDHFHKAALEQYPRDAEVITPASLKSSFRSLGFSRIHSLRPGKSLRLEESEIKLHITAHKTRHCSNPLFSPLINGGNGYTLEWSVDEEESYRIFLTGDSLPTQKLLKHIGNVKPQVIIVYAGAAHAGKGKLAQWTGPLTCGKKEVQLLAESFPNSRILPVHWGNFSHYRETYSEMDFLRYPNVKLMEPGDTLEIQR